MVVVFLEASQLGSVDRESVVSRCSLLSGEISQIFGMCSICRKRSSLSLPRKSKDSSGKVAITSSSKLHRAPRGARLLYLQCHTLALRTNSGSATDGNLRAGSRIKSRCTSGISFFPITALVQYLASALGQKRKFARACQPWLLVSNFIVLCPSLLFVHIGVRLTSMSFKLFRSAGQSP